MKKGYTWKQFKRSTEVDWEALLSYCGVVWDENYVVWEFVMSCEMNHMVWEIIDVVWDFSDVVWEFDYVV